MPLSAKQHELLETLEKTSASDFWTNATDLTEMAAAAHGQAGLVPHHDGGQTARHCTGAVA